MLFFKLSGTECTLDVRVCGEGREEFCLLLKGIGKSAMKIALETKIPCLSKEMVKQAEYWHDYPLDICESVPPLCKVI